MIQWMHTLSKSWFATLLMGGLTLSFVVWGIADVFTGSSGSAVATVGGSEIQQDEFARTYKNFVRNQGQQMGAEITPEMAQKMGLGQVALQQVISRTALNNEAARLGLTTPDSEVAQNVRAMQGFRGPLGTFDKTAFAQAIGNAGYTESEFLTEVRQDLTRGQMTQAVESSFLLPAGYAQALFLYINEKRAADYVIVSPDTAGAVPAPSDAVLAAYVKANPDRFSTPEYRTADYAWLTPADVAASVTVTDAQIKAQYELAKATYVVAEKRDIQQIEFKTAAEAAAARARIAAGQSFEMLVAQRGLKPDQISLGTLAESDLPDTDRAKAIFALPLNEVSQPIKTGFGGFVLARVIKIAPGVTRTLDMVKEDIRKTLSDQMAGNKLVDAANAFSDARSTGEDLTQAAKKSGMHVGHLASVDNAGLKPDGSKSDAPADPEFLPALFKAEVGEDGDPFVTKAGAYFAIRVNGVTPPKLKTLDLVRADATNSWTQEQKTKLVATKAVQLVAQADKDKSLDAIARELKVTVQHSPQLSRNTNDTMFGAPLVARLFEAGPGGIVMGPQGISGNFIIAKVTGIAHPLINPRDPNFQAGAQRLSGTVSGDFSIALANAARAKQGVKVNQKLVQTVVGGGS
ncbi:MAG: Peptidylprolyl isomerase [Alphaproteobacteria bacterium]|nr:Peptidylprolyl isomerase [Alphaproteobacteria bacterium]MDB5740069.1 Peptidylprolyl isomerase [Alphaproteobacteria bacterium]